MRETAAPASVWIFILLMVAGLVVAALPGDPVADPLPVAALAGLLWAYLLVRGSRAGWWIIVALYALFAVVMLALTDGPWDARPAAGFAITLASRAASWRRPRAAGSGSRHLETRSRSSPDENRPSVR